MLEYRYKIKRQSDDRFQLELLIIKPVQILQQEERFYATHRQACDAGKAWMLDKELKSESLK